MTDIPAVPASISPDAVIAAMPAAEKVVADVQKTVADAKAGNAQAVATDLETDIEDSKFFLASRTFWVNLGAIGLAIYEAYKGNAVASSTVIGGFGLINMLLRSYGGAKLTLKP